MTSLYRLILIGLVLLCVNQSQSQLTLRWSPYGIAGLARFRPAGYPSALFRLRHRGVPVFTSIRRYIENLQKRVYGRVLRANSHSFYQPPYPAFGSRPLPVQSYPGFVFPYLPRRPSATVNTVQHCDMVRQTNPAAANGAFSVTMNGQTMTVFCDFNFMGRNWVVFQRRQSATENFYRPWSDYENGFGDPTGDYWLGLANLYELTRAGSYTLRIDLQDFAGQSVYAEYDLFQIGTPGYKYRLRIGRYSGDAGDSLSYHRDFPFTTLDVDNDFHYQGRNCAEESRGAWWYNSCHYANLNGNYFSSAQIGTTGVTWYTWKSNYESLQSTAMRFRSN